MNQGWKGAAGPAVLFGLNLYVCRQLLTVEYTRWTGSIEAAYVSIARIIMGHWGDLLWFPEWYGGIPQQNSYPPLLHILTAGAGTAFGWTPARAHHFVSGMFYAFGPVALYWLAARLMESRLGGFLAGLVYSLLAPSAMLARQVRVDLGGAMLDRRLQVLVEYGEGPHIAAVALLPLALVLLDRAVRGRKGWETGAAAMAMAAVAVTNWLGAFALAAGALSLLLARTRRVDGEAARMWGWAGVTAAIAYAAASPWIPPSTIHMVRMNAPLIGGDYRVAANALPLILAAGIGLGAAAKAAMERWGVGAAGQTFGLFSFFMAAPALLGYWRGIALMPQPERYHVEMDLGLCALGAAVLWQVVERRSERLRWAVAAAIVLALVPQVARYGRYARGLIVAGDMKATADYKMDEALAANAGGGRVFAPGAASFWLNAFFDTPQIGGGFDQCRPYPWNAMLAYLIYAGPPDGAQHREASVLWLKAFGVGALGVAGAGTQEAYHTFPKPEDFAPLEVLWRGEGGDTVYRVPGAGGSLAHVIGAGDWMRRAPEGALDLDEVRRYDAAIEGRDARVEWTSRHSAVLTAEMKQDEVISFQETWHAGWRARVNGERRPVVADAIGQMVIQPRCAGECRVEMSYDGGAEMKAAEAASGAAMLGCVIWALWEARRRRAGA